MSSRFISGISPGFPELSQSQGQGAHVLLTRSPLIPRASPGSSFDLHVLSTPPAFVLSQDQTLREKTLSLLSAGTDNQIPRSSGEMIGSRMCSLAPDGAGAASAN